MKFIYLLVATFTLLPAGYIPHPATANSLILTPSSHSVLLEWGDSDNERSYKIYRDGELIYMTAKNETSFTDRALQENSSYHYEIKASDDSARFKLLPPSTNQVYLGAAPGFPAEDYMGSSSEAQTVINSFDTKAGKSAIWTYFTNSWSHIEYDESQKIRYPYENVEKILQTGKIPFIRLIPTTEVGIEPVDSDSAYDSTKTYPLDKIKNGDYDSEIEAWADAAKAHYISQKSAGHPFYLLLDFAVEMNAYWFQWGGMYQHPQTYKEAYQHIIDIFRAKEVPHVTWVFHPDLPDMVSYSELEPSDLWNYPDYNLWANPANYYPGDDYIDWIGFSLYARDEPFTQEDDSYPSFASRMESDFNYISAFSNKPIMVAEFGAMDHPDGPDIKAAWLSNALSYILNTDRIKAISYWNDAWWDDAAETKRIDMDIASTPESQQAFRTSISDPRFISNPKILSQP